MNRGGGYGNNDNANDNWGGGDQGWNAGGASDAWGAPQQPAQQEQAWGGQQNQAWGAANQNPPAANGWGDNNNNAGSGW